MNIDTFRSVLNESRNVTFVRFTAGWCSPCSVLAPHVDEWEQSIDVHLRDHVKFVTLDIDQHPDIFKYFKKLRQVTSIPTILAFDTRRERNSTDSIFPEFSHVGTNKKTVDAFIENAIRHCLADV